MALLERSLAGRAAGGIKPLPVCGAKPTLWAPGCRNQRQFGTYKSTSCAAAIASAQSEHGVTAAPARPAAAQAAAAPAAAQLSDAAEDGFAAFCRAAQGANIVPLYQRIFSDQLTPVLAYRCLVKDNDVQAPSYLLESVVNGDQQGRYSFVGAMPAMEVIATQNQVTVLDHCAGTRTTTTEADPMEVPVQLSRNWRPAHVEGLPDVFTGGWVGYAGYDTVRYVYSGKIPFSSAPEDDRGLPDLHLALYNDVVVFDQATKIIYAISWVHLPSSGTPSCSGSGSSTCTSSSSPSTASSSSSSSSTPSTSYATSNGSSSSGSSVDSEAALRAAYEAGLRRLQHTVELLSAPPPTLASGAVNMSLAQRPAPPGNSNMTKQEFLDSVLAAKEHILAGDIFQLVLSQRFERRTFAEPFEVYRALRVVNPSPYMVYMQSRSCIIVSSSPEILCRVDEKRVVTNRPLAGTRRRGETPEADVALEKELLADAKEVAEHVMLVDLGRNDVGKVSESGSVVVEKLMEVERYSHVMHISSTVTGKLLGELDAWDALRAALPAGTVSGAPKVRAMQIIDELETKRRGPYGGGFGFVSFTGNMDMALGLRTMVIPTASNDTLYSYAGPQSRREWVIHLQAGAGLVADSVPESEYEETVNKAAALGRAIDLAEQAFVGSSARR